MSDREQIEQQIREVLETETHAIALTNRLFSPGGLFGRLAETQDERRLVAKSSLFKEALRRLNTLQKQEVAEFARAVEQVRATRSEGGYLLKMEPAPSA
jgi:hypothetical protein